MDEIYSWAHSGANLYNVVTFYFYLIFNFCFLFYHRIEREKGNYLLQLSQQSLWIGIVVYKKRPKHFFLSFNRIPKMRICNGQREIREWYALFVSMFFHCFFVSVIRPWFHVLMPAGAVTWMAVRAGLLYPHQLIWLNLRQNRQTRLTEEEMLAPAAAAVVAEAAFHVSAFRGHCNIRVRHFLPLTTFVVHPNVQDSDLTANL